MDSRIKVDAAAIHEYERHLMNYAAFLRESFDRIERETATLGNSWQDPGYELFRERFRATQLALRQYFEEIDAVRPKLQEHAKRVESYDAARVDGR